jgi:hypothetical protein
MSQENVVKAAAMTARGKMELREYPFHRVIAIRPFSKST